jgi:peptidoglycan/xylan/chitin deacetylase (PgdA/CDA1 family)
MNLQRRAAAACVAASAATCVFYWVFLSPYSQAFGPYAWRGRDSDRVVALTFDDGPNEPYTSQIADILSDREIRATFFQVGWCVERSPATTAALAAAGHVIGNHSLSHRFRTYLQPGAFTREIEETQQILKRTLGKEPLLVRTPWLWRQPAILSMFRRRKLTPVSGLFCHALEVFQIDAARIARRAASKTRPGAILIFHDGFNARGGVRAETVKAVSMTIDALLNRGYRFVTVDELLGAPAYQPAAPTSPFASAAGGSQADIVGV